VVKKTPIHPSYHCNVQMKKITLRFGFTLYLLLQCL
jgi:hypothetical protein